MPLWQIEGAVALTASPALPIFSRLLASRCDKGTWLVTAPADLHQRHLRAGLLGHLPTTATTMMMTRTMVMMMRMMVARGGGDGQGRGGGGDGGGDVNHNDRGC